jgi:HEAT repeat protein
VLKKHSTLILSLGLFLTSCVGLTAKDGKSMGGNRADLATSQGGRNDFSQVKTWIQTLRSPDEGKREAAKNEIIALSGRSPESRQYTIKELIKVVAVPGGRAELIESPQRFSEWREAINILGTLRATEAIDVLIDCLDCNNGSSGLGPGRYPATVAIIKTGEEAIPKLTVALEQKPEGIRFMAVQALYSIGGEKAKGVLETASRKESNKQMLSVIRGALRNWSESGKYKP